MRARAWSSPDAICARRMPACTITYVCPKPWTPHRHDRGRADDHGRRVGLRLDRRPCRGTPASRRTPGSSRCRPNTDCSRPSPLRANPAPMRRPRACRCCSSRMAVRRPAGAVQPSRTIGNPSGGPDQGFLVVTVDGRGTPGRGPQWDRAIYETMKDVTLADQVEAVRALPALWSDDTRRAVGALDAAGGSRAGRLRFRRHRSAARHRAPERPARLPQARPGQGRDDRLVVRRLPVRARRARRARRRPRRLRRRAPDRLDALRHPLHRALPGPGPGGLPPQRHRGGRAQAAPSAHAHPRLRRRQRHHRPLGCG